MPPPLAENLLIQPQLEKFFPPPKVNSPPLTSYSLYTQVMLILFYRILFLALRKVRMVKCTPPHFSNKLIYKSTPSKISHHHPPPTPPLPPLNSIWETLTSGIFRIPGFFGHTISYTTSGSMFTCSVLVVI